MIMLKMEPCGKKCPICSSSLDIDTVVPGSPSIEPGTKPEKGDATFCFQCRSILVFNEALEPVIPTSAQFYAIAHNEGFYHFVKEIEAARAAKPNMN